MLTIGITGGIGSGKTTVCKVFTVLGVPVFQADSVAGKLQNEDPVVVSKLTTLFGNQIYSAEGLLDRKKLASIIFDNKFLLEEVNNIVHPAVHKAFDHWISKYGDFPYVIYEAAILFETGSFRNFDLSILVVAEEEERIGRVMKREKTTVDAIRNRMRNQMIDSEKIKLADYIINNNDNQSIIPQVLKLDEILKSKSHVRKMDW